MNSKTALKALLIFLASILPGLSFGQLQTLDSLRAEVQDLVEDSTATSSDLRNVLAAYLQQARSGKSPEDIIYAYQQLAAINYKSGDVNRALKYYKLYVLELEELSEFEEYKDHQFEINLYENEIRALQKQIEELEIENTDLKENKQINYEQNYIIYIGLRIALGLAIILFLGWLYQQYRKSKVKKTVLPEPASNTQELTTVLHKTKAELVSAETELALADILVQHNLTNANEYFDANKSLRRKFLLVQPRNLTSGAGLFLHTTKTNTLIAAFDTVSTGAPGGLLAGQIYHQLEAIIKNLGITSPALILEQLENGLLGVFPAGVPFAGGVSCGICLYNSSDRLMTFCSANLDLFELTGGTVQVHEGKLTPLLVEDTNKVYDNIVFEVERGSNFYLSTASYWLQQGGHDYKPLGRESFEKTIVSVYQQKVEEQEQILKKVFDEWRGGNEQYGDILVFGFKL